MKICIQIVGQQCSFVEARRTLIYEVVCGSLEPWKMSSLEK
jgi:hypothetical protein